MILSMGYYCVNNLLCCIWLCLAIVIVSLKKVGICFAFLIVKRNFAPENKS